MSSLLGGGGEAGAAHDGRDGGGIRRAAGEDVGDLAEVGAAEQAGRGDRQEARLRVAVVGEAVDGAARDAPRVAGADLDRLTVDRPGRRAVEPVDRLLES